MTERPTLPTMGRMTCRRCPGRAGPDYNEPRPRPTPMHRHRVIIGTESTTHTAKTTTLFHQRSQHTDTHTHAACYCCLFYYYHSQFNSEKSARRYCSGNCTSKVGKKTKLPGRRDLRWKSFGDTHQDFNQDGAGVLTTRLWGNSRST